MLEIYLPKSLLKIACLVLSDASKDRRARKAVKIAVANMTKHFYQAAVDEEVRTLLSRFGINADELDDLSQHLVDE